MPTRIAGYASVFGVPDSGGDIVRKGAFARAGGPVPLLWQHDAAHPIGTVDLLREDDRGLRVTATLADTRTARDAAALVRAKALTGLSFGYRVKAASPVAGHRHLTDLDLIEVSLVTFRCSASRASSPFQLRRMR